MLCLILKTGRIFSDMDDLGNVVIWGMAGAMVGIAGAHGYELVGGNDTSYRDIFREMTEVGLCLGVVAERLYHFYKSRKGRRV